MTDVMQLKQKAAAAALDFIKTGEILGVGTGSTVDCLIQLLPQVRHKIRAAVSSSERTTQQLKALDIPVVDINSIAGFSVYIDGADEIDQSFAMIKGGGAALTREKIVAVQADTFVCIVDERKCVATLGQFPLPIEVIPMAHAYVMRQLMALGGNPQRREDIVTDNGNWIIDVYGLAIHNPLELETQLNQITGVVCNGIFAMRRADHLIIANAEGARCYHAGTSTFPLNR